MFHSKLIFAAVFFESIIHFSVVLVKDEKRVSEADWIEEYDENQTQFDWFFSDVICVHSISAWSDYYPKYLLVNLLICHNYKWPGIELRNSTAKFRLKSIFEKMVENFQRITRDQWNVLATNTQRPPTQLIDMQTMSEEWNLNVLNILIASIAFMLECVWFSFKISDAKCRYFIGCGSCNFFKWKIPTEESATHTRSMPRVHTVDSWSENNV